MPSLTIDFTLFCSAFAILTLNRTWIVPGTPGVPGEPAFGTVSPLHVTLPFAKVPPLSADAKLVFAGIGSVIVTPVASALPMFFSVSV